MASVRSRLSDASDDLAGCAPGWLLSAACCPCAGSMSNPNLVAITTLLADRLQRLADQLFVGERTVDLGSIEEGHAAIDGRRGSA